MILHQFPDLQWLRNQADQRFENRKAWNGSLLKNKGWPTVILLTNTKNTYRDNILGPLSLFANISGESHITVDNKRVRVKEDFFLLTNEDQRYTFEIDQPKPTETFNIHFGNHFAQEVLNSVKKPIENLIDAPFTAEEQVLFYNRLQPHDQFSRQILHRIKNSAQDPLLIDECLYDLLVHLINNEKDFANTKSQLPVLRSSTRTELLKRLMLSTDYIFTHYDQALSLEELAKTACLSKFHFLRLFKIAFNKTPYQFINEVRLKKAKELLTRTKMEVSEIALCIGFENSSSFSRMFYNHLKCYPTRYRFK